jgi:hypothetical protein
VATWPACALLLPHVLAVVDHSGALEVETETTAQLRIAAGGYLWNSGQYRQAPMMYEQVLAGQRRVLGDDHPATLSAMNDLAAARHALGDFNGARDLYEQALGGRRRVLGDDHPDTLASLSNLAKVSRNLDEQ